MTSETTPTNPAAAPGNSNGSPDDVRPDAAELLELIEQQPNPDVEARLSPADRTLMAELRRDRALLCSSTPPPLPRDFVASLERPLLMEPRNATPGVYRRRHRKLAWARRRDRLAAAAVIGFVSLVGIALVATGGAMFGPELIARMKNAPKDAPATGSGSNEVVAPSRLATTGAPAPFESPQPLSPSAPIESSLDVAVHHVAPLPRREAVDVAALVDPDAGDHLEPRAAAFAVQLQMADDETLEGTLQTAFDTLRSDANTCVVRNVSLDEVRELVAQFHADSARRGRQPRPERVASPGGASGSVRNDDVRNDRDAGMRRLARELQDFHRDAPEENERVRRSHRILGRADLVPSYDDQLTFSQHGAAITMTLPARDLAAILESLYAQGVVVSLVGLDQPDSDAVGDDIIAGYRAARRDVDAWREEGDARPVMVPVMSAR